MGGEGIFFVRRWICLLLACGCLALIGVEAKRPEPASDLVLRHANGLIVPRPHGYVESPTDSGFLFAETRRSVLPLTVRISVVDRAPLHYGTQQKQLSMLAGTATYAVSREFLYNGSRRPRLTAFRAEGDQWLIVEASSEFDGEMPDFSPAWRILDQARISRAF